MARPDPAPPAAPRPPRLPDALATHVSVDDLDELYPDIDGVALDGGALPLPDARSVGVLRSRLRAIEIVAPLDAPLELRDAVLEGVDLVGRRIAGAVRATFLRCRLSGADLSDAAIEDVVFDDCALDLASWRVARVRRVAVLGGRIEGLDATGADLGDVALASVSLAGVVLDGVRSERFDLTEADLSLVESPASLAGATISAPQAIALAPRLARTMGIGVRATDDVG